MDLILWRHAEACDLRDGQDDLERALTGRGEHQARRMAAWLARRLPATARVLASPARRAQQTACVLDRRCKSVPALAPGGTVEALLAAAGWPDGRGSVVVVGHQPTLGLAAAHVLRGRAQAWTLRKGALVWLRTRRRAAQWQVVLHAAMSPELL